MAEFIAKQGIISKGNVVVTGSVTATSFTGSMFGTASFARSASFATTASYSLGIPTIKCGQISGSSFLGSPKKVTVTFIKPFPNNNYGITVLGEISTTWTVESKTPASLIINANRNGAFTGLVYWQAISNGEFYS